MNSVISRAGSKIRLSAILITKNEASEIEDCINSLSFCDEIILVDNGSTDHTVAIAKRMGCRVFETTDWPGFGAQKQRSLDQARGEWILSIDADERVTLSLQEEIEDVISKNRHEGYMIKRRSQFLGRWMRFGGWYPDYVLRLAKREFCRFDPTPIHEKLIVAGDIGKLRNHFLHYSYRSISDVLDKQKRYALLSAKKIRSQKDRHTSLLEACGRAGWTFLRLYVLRLGILDGSHGFISAVYKAQEVFWKYVAVKFANED